MHVRGWSLSIKFGVHLLCRDIIIPCIVADNNFTESTPFSMGQSLYRIICLFVCLYVCLSVCLSVCLLPCLLSRSLNHSLACPPARSLTHRATAWHGNSNDVFLSVSLSQSCNLHKIGMHISYKVLLYMMYIHITYSNAGTDSLEL